MLTTALREVREARVLIDPEKKRKQKAPPKGRARNRDKRVKK
jgi:hypothetical protein